MIKVFFIWLCAALFYAYQYVLRVLPNVLKGDIYDVFHFNDVTFGQFASFWYLGYALSHIPVGVALDRYGVKVLLPFSAFLCVCGVMPLLLFEHSSGVIFGRFLLGVGSTGATLGMFKVVRSYFSAESFTRILSITCVIGVLGAIFGGAPIYFLLKIYSWKFIIALISSVGLMLAIVSYFLLEKQPVVENANTLSMLQILLKNKYLWMISLGAGFLAGPLEGFADAWAMESLSTIYNLSKDVTSQATSIIFGGFIIGLFLISYLIDWIGGIKASILCGLMMLGSFLALLSGIISYPIIVICLLMLGAFSAYQVAAIYEALTLFEERHTGLVTAIFNMIMMIFGSYFHTIIGSCVYQFGLHAPMIDGVCKNTAETYQKGLMVIPIMLFLGVFLFFVTNYKNKHIRKG